MKERKKENSDVATGVNYVVASFSGSLSLYVILKQAHEYYCLLSKVSTMNRHGQANRRLSPHMVD